MKFLAFIFLLFPLSSFGALCSNCKTDLAIYAPPNNGVWAFEVNALEKIIHRFHLSYEVVNFDQIKAGYLGEGPSRKFHGLVMPGGPINARVASLGVSGREEIDQFIKSGGNYIGFCGGSYLAGEKYVFAYNATGGSGTYHVREDYNAYSGDGLLGLFSGTIVGPFGWAPYRNGAIADGLEETRFNMSLPILKSMGLNTFSKLFYYGGPFFNFDVTPANLEVWAWAVKPPSVPEEASIGNGRPTIIRYRFGLGNVILSSYHLAVLLGGKIGSEFIESPYSEKVEHPDPSPFSLDQVNLQSLNLLHGALLMTDDSRGAPPMKQNVH
jgi:glutamine amidotransferase-like uncharacterized protein